MFFTLAFPILLILVFGTIIISQDKVSYSLLVQDFDRTIGASRQHPEAQAGSR